MAKNERIEKREQNIKARKLGGPAPGAGSGEASGPANRAGFEGRKRGFLNDKPPPQGSKTAHLDSNARSEGNRKQ
jgi:hypothetical protein